MPYFSSPELAKFIPYDDPVAAMSGGFGIIMSPKRVNPLVPEQRVAADEQADKRTALQKALALLRPVYKDTEVTLPTAERPQEFPDPEIHTREQMERIEDDIAKMQRQNSYNYSLYLMRLAMQGRPILGSGNENPTAVSAAMVYLEQRDALADAGIAPNAEYEITEPLDNVVYIHAAA